MKSFKVLVFMVLIFGIVSCANKDKKTLDHASSATLKMAETKKTEDCSFQPSNVSQSSCYVSYYALLANPDMYQGKRIFTYAYLIKGSAEDSGYLLRAENRMRKVNDGASCIRFFDQVKNDDVKLDGVKGKTFYSVALAGTFYRNLDPPCVGILRQVDISQLAQE